MDDRLRALETTWQRTQSPTDELALLRARLRAGSLDAGRLELAAWGGHEGAKSLLPPKSWAGPPADERGWANWVAARGPVASVLVGYWLVRSALQLSKEVLVRRSGAEVYLEAHAAIVAWIRDPAPERLRACQIQEQALRGALGRFKLEESFQKRTHEALGVLLATPSDPALLENVVYLLLLASSYGEPTIERGPSLGQDLASWALGHALPGPLGWETVPAESVVTDSEAPWDCPQLPPWEELAESERWFRIVGLSRKWYASPLSSADGMEVGAIVELQSGIGQPLPRALCEWLALAGERLTHVDWVGLTPGITVHLAEDQYLRYWIRSEDLGSADPPVYTYDANDEEERAAESFSEFLLLEVLAQTLALTEFEEDLLLGQHAGHVRRGVTRKVGDARRIRAALAPLFPEVSAGETNEELKRSWWGDAETIASSLGSILRLATRAGRDWQGIDLV